MTAFQRLFVTVLVGAAPAARAADLVILPVASARADEVLVVTARTTVAPAGTLELRWRGHEGEEQVTEFRRASAESWEARIPADNVAPPTLSIRVVERKDLQEREILGSLTEPISVPVVLEGKSAEQAERLREAGGRRSEATASVESVHFGTSTEGGRDALVQAEVGYRYRMLNAVSAIRLGGGTIRGQTPSPRGSGESMPAGYDYGFAELTFGGGPFELDVRGNLGANQSGFRLGGGVTARLGPTNGTHVELGGNLIDGIGVSGRMLLHWDTVPSFPMAAGVEVTDMPGGGATAVRLLSQVEWRVSDMFSIGLNGGYQARSSLLGGAAIGGRLALRF